MITISFNTIENIIFLNKDIQSLLPEFTDKFKSWHIGKVSGLDILVQKAIVELLNELTNEHLNKIGQYLQSEIKIDKVSPDIVKNLDCNLLEAEELLNFEPNFQGNLSLSREGDHIYISIWR